MKVELREPQEGGEEGLQEQRDQGPQENNSLRLTETEVAVPEPAWLCTQFSAYML